jgi:hypothetical protein
MEQKGETEEGKKCIEGRRGHRRCLLRSLSLFDNMLLAFVLLEENIKISACSDMKLGVFHYLLSWG